MFHWRCPYKEMCNPLRELGRQELELRNRSLQVCEQKSRIREGDVYSILYDVVSWIRHKRSVLTGQIRLLHTHNHFGHRHRYTLRLSY